MLYSRAVNRQFFSPPPLAYVYIRLSVHALFTPYRLYDEYHSYFSSERVSMHEAWPKQSMSLEINRTKNEKTVVEKEKGERRKRRRDEAEQEISTVAVNLL